MITLGSMGEDLTVVIPIGARFLCALDSSNPWPNGTQIELHLMNDPGDTPVIWPATISGSTATFDVPAGDVKTVTDARLSLARLLYNPAGAGFLLWGHGTTRYV
jgi:hypothetical protein